MKKDCKKMCEECSDTSLPVAFLPDGYVQMPFSQAGPMVTALLIAGRLMMKCGIKPRKGAKFIRTAMKAKSINELVGGDPLMAISVLQDAIEAPAGLVVNAELLKFADDIASHVFACDKVAPKEVPDGILN